MNQLNPRVCFIFAIYFVFISLWATGASVITSNINAEHLIGMFGPGFVLGLAISACKWMAAATLVIVAVFLLPVYLNNKICTMPGWSVFTAGILAALYIHPGKNILVNFKNKRNMFSGL